MNTQLLFGELLDSKRVVIYCDWARVFCNYKIPTAAMMMMRTNCILET